LRLYGNPFKLERVTELTNDGEPIFVKGVADVEVVGDYFFLLQMDMQPLVVQYDAMGKRVRALGDGYFNKRPRFIRSMVTFKNDQLVVGNNRQLFFFDTTGKIQNQVNLRDDYATAFTFLDDQQMVVMDFASYDYKEDWHYIMNIKTKKKTYFDKRVGDIYQILHKDRGKNRYRNFGNPHVLKINEQLWFASSHGSSIFIYDLNGEIQKRLFLPRFDALVLEEIQETEMARNAFHYFSGYTRTARIISDGDFVYQLTINGDNSSSCYVYDHEGRMVLQNFSFEEGLPSLIGGGNGKLYGTLQTYDLEDDEQLSEDVKRLIPAIKDPSALRRDGLWLCVYSFDPPKQF
jgi:hypothetical protein